MENKNMRRAELTHAYALYGLQLIKVTFPFDKEDLLKIRTLQDRKYIPEEKCWTCKFQIENIEKLKQWGFELDQTLESTFSRSMVSAKDVKEIDVPGLKGKLFPFQNIGVSFIESKNGRALVADEMGLGKTVQALAWLQLHPELRPAIVVVPASLKLNWLKEAQRWMPNPRAVVLSGTKPYLVRGEIVIVNYDIVSFWLDYLVKLGFKVLIMDEIHLIKASSTKRTKAVKKLAKGIHHIIGLSGTPIVNRPIEMYNALTLIDSSVMPNFKEYTKRYCGAKYNGFGWDYNGATNTEELHKKLVDTIMIRRKKSDVLKDLPDKIKSYVPMELENQDEYDDAEADFIFYLKNMKGEEAAQIASRAEPLAKIEGLKQLALQGKINACIDWIDEFLTSGQKLVIFAVHKSAIDMLMNHFGKIAVKVDGSVSMIERNRSVEEFQNNEKVRLFVGNIQAAGVGLTLTTASNVAFIEYGWSPSLMLQCEDRVHRIGQKDSVTVYYLLAENTIEQKIVSLLAKKQQIISSVLDGIPESVLNIFDELIKEFS